MVKEELAPAAIARLASRRMAAQTAGRTSGCRVSKTSLPDAKGPKPPRPKPRALRGSSRAMSVGNDRRRTGEDVGV
eukprot:scaffold10630_cov90-Isochrysis_galbana.AAC.3